MIYYQYLTLNLLHVLQIIDIRRKISYDILFVMELRTAEDDLSKSQSRIISVNYQQGNEAQANSSQVYPADIDN